MLDRESIVMGYRLKLYKRSRTGELTRESVGKLTTNLTQEVNHGQRSSQSMLRDIIADDKLAKLHDKRRNSHIYCPQCRLLIGRPIVLALRSMLYEHLLNHRIQRALGCELEWVNKHAHVKGYWRELRVMEDSKQP